MVDGYAVGANNCYYKCIILIAGNRVSCGMAQIFIWVFVNAKFHQLALGI